MTQLTPSSPLCICKPKKRPKLLVQQKNKLDMLWMTLLGLENMKNMLNIKVVFPFFFHHSKLVNKIRKKKIISIYPHVRIR